MSLWDDFYNQLRLYADNAPAIRRGFLEWKATTTQTGFVPRDNAAGTGPVETGPVEGGATGGVPSKWSTADATGFYLTRDWLMSINPTLRAAEADAILNQWAAQFHTNNGRYPTFGDAQTSLQQGQSPASVGGEVPGLFAMRGEQGLALFQMTGDYPIQLSDDESGRILAAMGLPTRPFAEDLAREGIPTLTADQLSTILRNRPGSIGGGGGFGGGGRRDPVYDEAQLADRFREQWRARLLEEPADLDAKVKRFVKEATAFWRAGGQKDPTAWLEQQIRTTDRYKMLYALKDESMSDDEWLGQFLGIARQSGMPADITTQAAIRGASTGAAPAAFAESITDTADFQAMGTGNMSRNFASLLSQLQPLQRGVR